MVPWSSIWLIHKRFSSIRRLSKSAWAALSDPSTLCWLRSLKKCKPWKRGQVEKETTNKVFAGQVDTLGGSGEIPSWTSMFRLFFLFGIKWMIHGFNNWFFWRLPLHKQTNIRHTSNCRQNPPLYLNHLMWSLMVATPFGLIMSKSSPQILQLKCKFRGWVPLLYYSETRVTEFVR